MGRHEDTGLGRRRRIAEKLGLKPADPGQFEGRCPVCGRPGFSIKRPDRSDYLHIWTCAADRAERRCSREAIRASLLHQFPVSWIGSYGLNSKAVDPQEAAVLREAVDSILGFPGLKPRNIRVILAEARGHKAPDDFSEHVRWAQDVAGIGRRQAYESAAEFCRPSDVPHPGGESADAQS